MGTSFPKSARNKRRLKKQSSRREAFNKTFDKGIKLFEEAVETIESNLTAIGRVPQESVYRLPRIGVEDPLDA